jgi:hypothetical protein
MRHVANSEGEIAITSLRRTFPDRILKKLIPEADLQVSWSEEHENLKCLVVVCRKIKR